MCDRARPTQRAGGLVVLVFVGGRGVRARKYHKFERKKKVK